MVIPFRGEKIPLLGNLGGSTPNKSAHQRYETMTRLTMQKRKIAFVLTVL
jgi:hypothetical protein